MASQDTPNALEESLSITAQLDFTPNDRELSIIETGKDLREFQDDMIPDELLRALTQSDYTTLDDNKEQLAPIKKTKTPEKLRLALNRGPPANVWNHKGRRTLFKHLTDNPRSMGKGVGTRDVSFLYDVSTHRKPQPPPPSKLDRSAVRLEGAQQAGDIQTVRTSHLAVPDTVIPDEYHVVKSKAVLGLEYIDEPLVTKLKDQEAILRLFPSLNPNKRFEVVQLLKTLDSMLQKTGLNDPILEIQGPTQIHNLLELIKKEQNIYDVVFAEVIRQVSVECVERGQLLSNLRQKYADLLNRVPRQLKSLHAEVMAQRSLDRRLTEELLRFKTSITVLTTELHSVRAHDEKVTEEASQAEAQLAQALRESQTNANLVDEYHDLYEMQRRRLEEHVQAVTQEKDLWSNAAYSLALKIMSTNNLSTVKRLNVSEKAWAQLANHFSVMLSDKDSENLADIQKFVSQWRDLMFRFNQNMESADRATADVLRKVMNGLHKWSNTFEELQAPTGPDEVRSITIPPQETLKKLCYEVKKWEEALADGAERFGGATLLGAQEQLKHMAEKTEKWNELAYGIYRRHTTKEGNKSPLADTLADLNVTLHDLIKQLDTRVTGENGVARAMIFIQNNLGNWINKMMMMASGSQPFNESEWLQLQGKLSEYADIVEEALQFVGSQQSEEDRQNSLPHTRIEVAQTMDEVQRWMKMTLSQIESEDGKLMAQAGSIHTKLIHWLIEALMHLAPNHSSVTSKTPSSTTMISVSTKEDLLNKAREIADHLTHFTNYLSKCAASIVTESMQAKKDVGDEDADHEFRDFIRMKREATEWIRTCQILINSVTSEPMTLLTNDLKALLEAPDEEAKLSALNATAASGKRRSTQVGAEAVAQSINKFPARTHIGQEQSHPTPISSVPTATSTTDARAVATTSADADAVGMNADGTAAVADDTAMRSTVGGKEQVSKTVEKMGTTKNKINDQAAAAEDSKDSAKQNTEDSSASPNGLPERMEVIGADDNVNTAPILANTGRSTIIGSGTELTAPTSSLTQSAFDAIAKMDEVQNQLLATEKRAQVAEEQVFDLEDELNSAQEKIRSLERQITELTDETSKEDKSGAAAETEKDSNADESKLNDTKKSAGSDSSSKKPTSRPTTTNKKKVTKKK